MQGALKACEDSAPGIGTMLLITRTMFINKICIRAGKPAQCCQAGLLEQAATTRAGWTQATLAHLLHKPALQGQAGLQVGPWAGRRGGQAQLWAGSAGYPNSILHQQPDPSATVHWDARLCGALQWGQGQCPWAVPFCPFSFPSVDALYPVLSAAVQRAEPAAPRASPATFSSSVCSFLMSRSL